MSRLISNSIGHLLGVVSLILALQASMARAGDGSEYLKLGISGDGVTPSASDLRAGLERSVKGGNYAASASWALRSSSSIHRRG